MNAPIRLLRLVHHALLHEIAGDCNSDHSVLGVYYLMLAEGTTAIEGTPLRPTARSVLPTTYLYCSPLVHTAHHSFINSP